MLKDFELNLDFGLRSIKAIVLIADKLKLQAQNVFESELSHIIDDNLLNSVSYKSDQIIKDALDDTEKKLDKAIR